MFRGIFYILENIYFIKDNKVWTYSELLEGGEAAGLKFKADMIMIHPKLSTSQDFMFTPDISLLREAQ